MRRTPRAVRARPLPEPPLSVPEVAQLLGVHEQTVRRYLRRKKLRGSRTPSDSKFGHHWRIARADVETFRARGLNATHVVASPIRERAPSARKGRAHLSVG